MVPKFPSGADVATHRDPAPARKSVNSAVFAKSREISVRMRLRGGGRSPSRNRLHSQIPC
jgi:hypothetical protein